MTKTAKRIASELPATAREVLEGMPGSRIGQTVPLAGPNTMIVRAHLIGAGLIGANDGLTIKGSAAAMIVQGEYLDRMFG